MLSYTSMCEIRTFSYTWRFQAEPPHIAHYWDYPLLETEVKFSFKFSFYIEAFDKYAFISLKLIACRIFVFLNGLFEGSKFA